MPESKEAKTVKITINDHELEVPEGEWIVESAKRLKVDIPIFCYHPRMVPVGMCRMCLVEVGMKQPDGSVRKMPKPQTACSLPATEGLVIHTDTEQIHQDRKGVLEFLLINHPLDCPVCDRGGECPLQNNTQFYGPSTSRYTELKRHLPKAYPLSKHVTLDLERCIQCGRCVRFTEEISGDSQLAFLHRGAWMQPSTFHLLDFDSKFSGNTIEICPVGALTSTDYRFRARPWDLETTPSICTQCSNGCSIWMDHRSGKFVRVNARTNESVNEEWTCDKGKFGHAFYNSSKRLSVPLIRKGDHFVQATWSNAYQEIVNGFSGKPGQVAALIKPNLSNEGLYLMQKLFRKVFQSNHLDHRWTSYFQKSADRLEIKAGINQVQSSLLGIEKQKVIFVFGSLLENEEPILYLKIRKAYQRKNAKVILASEHPGYVDLFASTALHYHPGTEKTLIAGILREVLHHKKKTEHAELLKYLEHLTPSYVEKVTGVPHRNLKLVAEILSKESGVIVSTQNLMNQKDGQLLIELLAGLAFYTSSEFNCFALDANQQGAEYFGILPDLLPGGILISDAEKGFNTYEILDAAAKRNLKALWLVNVDPVSDYPDQTLATSALLNVDFLVYQGVLENESMGYASVVLPMLAPAEQEGTYMNLENRVQRICRAMTGPAEAKPDWGIFNEVALRANTEKSYFTALDVMEEIKESVHAFKEVNTKSIEDEGLLVQPFLPSVPCPDFLHHTLETLHQLEKREQAQYGS